MVGIKAHTMQKCKNEEDRVEDPRTDHSTKEEKSSIEWKDGKEEEAAASGEEKEHSSVLWRRG